ncbi:DNA primase [Pseudorhodoferax sp.]|uniref:DNA primase n=1 Tax=Pseudorhodoferax sp. TaxID=1993553 RepID=UPI0039E57772
MAIPQSFIQELLSRVDVVEVVGRYVQLKKGGANFLGLCPFHGEKSPSFTVSPSKQFFHCFGCGKSGNAIGFLMEHTGAGFRDAVQDLAQQVGMAVPDDDSTPEERQRAAAQRERQATLTEVLEKAGEAWRHQLRQAPRAIDYCKRRGLSGRIAKRFGLGYAPEGWHFLSGVFPRYDDALLVDSGLVIHHEEGEDRRYDRFRDRLMFPIRNVKGECIAFGGRVLGDEKPKYLNSPETPVFSKGRELYGLYEAREAVRDMGYVLVTEGYMDVVALAQHGFPNAVATLGTACTPEHVHKLFRFTDAVVFSFDGDAAGRRAARKALEGALPYATDVRSVKFLFLPPEHDPDSYIREHGADAFSLSIGEAQPLSRFLIDSAREGCDLGSAEGRAHLASNARPLWALLPDGALKRQLLGDLADLVQLDARELGELWEPRAAPDAPRPRRRPSGKRSADVPSSTMRGRSAIRPALQAHASHVAMLLLRNTGLWEQLGQADHDLLCALEGDYGELFRWTDQQVHEHGAQPWAALDIALAGQPFEAEARRLVARDSLQPLGRVFEIEDVPLADVRATLTRLHRDVIAEELRHLQTLPASDPERIGRERELILRQLALKKSLA